THRPIGAWLSRILPFILLIIVFLGVDPSVDWLYERLYGAEYDVQQLFADRMTDDKHWLYGFLAILSIGVTLFVVAGARRQQAQLHQATEPTPALRNWMSLRIGALALCYFPTFVPILIFSHGSPYFFWAFMIWFGVLAFSIPTLFPWLALKKA